MDQTLQIFIVITNIISSFLYIFITSVQVTLLMILKRTTSKSENNNGQSQRPQSVKSDGSDRKKIRISLTRHLKANSLKRQEEAPIGVSDIFRSALRMFVCKMCYNNVELKDTATIGECQHTFCTSCLSQYCIYQININQDIYCPEESCEAKLKQSSQFFALLPEQMQKKFKEHQIWKLTLNDPNKKICPSETCQGGIVDLTKNPPQCQKCHTKYCQECMMAFHEGPCDQNFSSYFKEWKRCRQCKVFIQKIQGCNHMTCRCGHQFCFVCCQPWASSHYQCIQGLDNRLFFNQVEQIPKGTAFLAFVGALLLFPLLFIGFIILFVLGVSLSIVVGILVAPCVLFSKLNGCHQCICFILGLPFAIIIIGLVSPIFFIITIFKPFVRRVCVQNCNTLNFLKDQLFRGQANHRNQI